MDDAIKAAIRQYYQGVCQYCGAVGAHHVDHIIPRCRGGADDLSNLTLSCKRSNTKKGSTMLDPMYIAIAHARARENALSIRRGRQPLKQVTANSMFFRKAVRIYGWEEALRRFNLVTEE